MDEGLFLLLPFDAKARDYFDQLFTATLWDLLVVDAGMHNRRVKPFEVTSMADMKAFVALTAAMSIRKLPRISNCCSSYWVPSVQQFAKTVYKESIHVFAVQYTFSG